MEPDILKLYGGTYSGDCGNATATRLRVVADALMVEQGNKRLTANNVQAQHSVFGRSSPPNYMVALTGDVRGGSQTFFRCGVGSVVDERMGKEQVTLSKTSTGQ